MEELIPKNTYEIIFSRVLGLDCLTDVHTDISDAIDCIKDVNTQDDNTDGVVNSLESSLRDSNNKLESLRMSVVRTLGGNEVDPHIVSNSADKEKGLYDAFLKDIVSHWSKVGFKKMPKHLGDRFLVINEARADNPTSTGMLTPESIDAILERRYVSEKGQKETTYMASSRKMRMHLGYWQLLRYSSHGGVVDFSKTKLPSKSHKIAVTGRTKQFASAAEKVIRETAEYVVKRQYFVEKRISDLNPLDLLNYFPEGMIRGKNIHSLNVEDLIKIKPYLPKGFLQGLDDVKEEVLSNDLIAMKVIFPTVAQFYDHDPRKRIADGIHTYVKSQLGEAAASPLTTYKKVGEKISDSEIKDRDFSVVYFDVLSPENRRVEAEIQVTNWLDYCNDDIVGERAHKMYKEQQKTKGLPDEFFSKPEMLDAWDEWRESQKCKKKARTKKAFQKEVRSLYKTVYNALVEKVELFMDKVRNDDGMEQHPVYRDLFYKPNDYLLKF